jgi:hypothetical protein
LKLFAFSSKFLALGLASDTSFSFLGVSFLSRFFEELEEDISLLNNSFSSSEFEEFVRDPSSSSSSSCSIFFFVLILKFYLQPVLLV